MQFIGCEHMPRESFDQRLHQTETSADPLSHGRALQFHAFAGIDLRLPVKRQVIAELRDQHMSQKAAQ